MVIGLDVHKKETVGFVVHGDDLDSGEWFTVPTTNEHLEDQLDLFEDHKVLVEASTSGKAVAWFLKARGVDVDLVQADVLTGHVRYAKSDKLDAQDLAKIGAFGGYKTCYIPTQEEEEIRAVVRHIHDLRKQMVRIKNQARAVLQRNLVPDPPGNLKHEHVRARWRHLELPEAEKRALDSKLEILERLREEDEQARLVLSRLVHEHPSLATLLTIPSVDVITAAAVIGFCGDMHRFPKAKKVASYAGLTPRLNQSGETTRHGRITKKGPHILRWVLVQAAHNIVRQPGQMRNKYQRLSARIGKGKAIIAIARTLITAMWSMLVNDRPYRDGEDAASDAKRWRARMVVELVDAGHGEAARRLLHTRDVKRAHDCWLRGTSRMVPAL